MATSAELIRVEHVIKEYNHGAVKALNDCSLSIKKGEVVAIIGPSGSGKSTLLTVLLSGQIIGFVQRFRRPEKKAVPENT